MRVSGECGRQGEALAEIVKAHPEALAGASSILLGNVDLQRSGVFDHCAALGAVQKEAAWKDGVAGGQAALSLSSALSATPLNANLAQALDAAQMKASGVSAETVIMGGGAPPDCPGSLPNPLPTGATIWISLEQK